MNAASGPAPNRVMIDRLDCQCLVARNHPRPAQLRDRLDRVIRTRLAEVCGRMLASAMDKDESAVWVVRRLDIDLALDAGALDDDRLTQVMAEAFAGGILRAIGLNRRSPGGPELAALRFPSRAAYLARFIGDLASGAAWDRWYYQPFESLHSLPDGMALAEALVREPEQAGEALRLAKQAGALERVVATLGETGARKVFHALQPVEAAQLGISSPFVAPQMLAVLAEAWPRARAALHAAGAEESGSRAALLLWLEATQPNVGGAATAEAGEMARAVMTFLQRVQSPQALIKPSDWAQPMDIDHLPGKAGASSFSRNFSAREASWQAPAPATSAWTEFPTPFASAFLLLPALLDLDPATLAPGLPETNITGLDPAAILRYLVLVKCFGRSQSRLAAADPTVLLAAGLESQPPAGAVAEYSRSLGTGFIRDLQDRLATRLIELRWAEGQRLEVDLGPARLADPACSDPQEVFLLLRDAAHGFWLHAETAQPSGLPAALAKIAARVSDPLNFPVLLRAESLEGEPDSGLLTHLRLAAEAQERPETFVLPRAPLPPDMEESAAHLRPAGHDLAFFSLRGLEALSLENPSFDLTCSLVASATLRSFARRLLGFHWNSAEYLYRNFLSGTGSVRLSAEGIEVHLPRPPLHMVLHMTGIDGKTFRVPWLGDQTVTLRLSEASL